MGMFRKPAVRFKVGSKTYEVGYWVLFANRNDTVALTVLTPSGATDKQILDPLTFVTWGTCDSDRVGVRNDMEFKLTSVQILDYSADIVVDPLNEAAGELRYAKLPSIPGERFLPNGFTWCMLCDSMIYWQSQ